jgi:hypothetical protein
VLEPGRAPPSRSYKTDSRHPYLTPKPHRPFSLPSEPPTVTTCAISVADRPPPSISLHSPSPTKVRSGMSCPQPPLRLPHLPVVPMAWVAGAPSPSTGRPPCRLPSLFGSKEEEGHLPHNLLLYFLFYPRPSHFFSLSHSFIKSPWIS